MIVNQDGQAFDGNTFFNATFIKNNKIKTINGSYSFKKNGDLIRKVPGSYTYSFDKEGRLAAIEDLKWNGKKIDTLLNLYTYNSEGSLAALKKSEYGGITEQKMAYDSSGRLDKITNYRVLIDRSGNTVQKTEINSETIQYNGDKSTKLNAYGLPYLIAYDVFDEYGYKIASIEKLKRSGTVTKKKYLYNNKGILETLESYYDKNIDPVETISFSYDTFGNITERLQKKMNILVNDLQVIYDTKTQLLYSIIRRNPSTNFMEIVRFTTYEYYP